MMFPKTCMHPSGTPPHAPLHMPAHWMGSAAQWHKHCLLDSQEKKHWKGEMVQNKNAWSSMLSSGRKYLEICTWTYARFSTVSHLKWKWEEEYSECYIQSDKMIALKSNTWHFLFLCTYSSTYVAFFNALTTESSAWTLLLKCDRASGCCLLPFSSTHTLCSRMWSLLLQTPDSSLNWLLEKK